MKVHLISRSQKAFSVEAVFAIIQKNMAKEVEYINWKSPAKRDMPLSLIINLLHALYIRFFIAGSNDLFHISGVNHYLVLVLPKNKTLLTVHDCVKYHQHQGVKRKFVQYFWCILPFTRAKYLTAISQKTKEEMVMLSGCEANKIEVIYNPANPVFKNNHSKNQNPYPIILHIGTKKNKNLENLIEAIENINCRLFIVGSLELSQSNLLKEKNINFENFVDITDSEIESLYQQCDLVSFITTYEGFGLPIIEGQLHEKPVITSNIEPHIEIAGKGALLVSPDSISEINKGIYNILTDEKLRGQLIIDGIINAKRFSVEKITNEYLNIYKLMSQ